MSMVNDLTQQAHADQQRIKRLENQLQSLKDRYVPTSSGRSSATTSTHQEDTSITVNGPKTSAQKPMSSQPLRKRTASCSSGKAQPSAQTAPPAVLIAEGQTSASYRRVLSGKQRASIATNATHIPVGHHSDPSSLTPSSKGSEAKERKLKNRVKLNNASFNDPRNREAVASQDPVFVPKSKQTSRSFLSGTTKRAIRKTNVSEVEEDWFYYLCTEFMFEERHAAILRAMRNKLEKYARTYDMSDVTPKQKYAMMLKTINAAFFISEEEQAVRQSMKSSDHLTELHKNNLFVSKGQAGNTWGLFGKKSHQLPIKTPA